MGRELQKKKRRSGRMPVQQHCRRELGQKGNTFPKLPPSRARVPPARADGRRRGPPGQVLHRGAAGCPFRRRRRLFLVLAILGPGRARRLGQDHPRDPSPGRPRQPPQRPPPPPRRRRRRGRWGPWRPAGRDGARGRRLPKDEEAPGGARGVGRHRRRRRGGHDGRGARARPAGAQPGAPQGEAPERARGRVAGPPGGAARRRHPRHGPRREPQPDAADGGRHCAQAEEAECVRKGRRAVAGRCRCCCSPSPSAEGKNENLHALDI
ncbi:hypothetical protein IF2G_09759 [Cordyceps javanica]|nr:hypothetical protein IF2G_09759 [Cordyceps javanica]